MKHKLHFLLILTFVLLSITPFAVAQAKPPLRVGLVLQGDQGPYPWSYDGMAIQGLDLANKKFGVVGEVFYYEGPVPGDYNIYYANLLECVSNANDLCIAVGFYPSGAIWDAALAFPGTKFAIIDYTYNDDYPANLSSTWMKRGEEGYLAGFLAGLLTGANTVGVVAGMDIPPVRDLAVGYRYGAQCANPAVEVLINYTGSFADPDLGAQVAEDMINQGADVIFNSAGGTGSGAIRRAAELGKWAIGVDVDEYFTTFGGGAIAGSQYLVTSTYNKLDQAVLHTIEALVKSKFTPGPRLTGLAEGETGLAPYHDSSPLVAKTITDHMAKLQKDVATGAVSVDQSCRSMIGFVTAGEDLEGNYWNFGPITGFQQAQTDFGFDGTIFVTQADDYYSTLMSCVNQGNQLCISSGFQAYEPTKDLAWQNPGVDFAIVDYDMASDLNPAPNMRALWFAHGESGYLAGALAGKMSSSDVIGAIGGFPVPAVVDYITGYRNGAGCANSGIVVLETYINDFNDPVAGANAAQTMINQSADVIFAAAGPTGTGAMYQATSQGVWGIGVDSDEWVTSFQNGSLPGSEFMLSSAMKYLDFATYDTIEKYLLGNYTTGTELYDLEVRGVGLAPYHAAEPFVSQAVRDYIKTVRQGIINGKIDVTMPCQ